MKISDVFDENERGIAFKSYEEYTTYLFYLVDYQLFEVLLLVSLLVVSLLVVHYCFHLLYMR